VFKNDLFTTAQKRFIFLFAITLFPGEFEHYSLNTARVNRSVESFLRTFCRFVVIEILLHAYFEYVLNIVVLHIFSNKHF